MLNPLETVSIIRFKNLDIVPVEKEVYRYLGVSPKDLLDLPLFKKKNTGFAELVEKGIREVQALILPAVVYGEQEIKKAEGNNIFFENFAVASSSLAVNLKDCSKATLVAGTIGPRIDRLIQKTSRFNAGLSGIYQAAGAMFIEEVIEKLNLLINERAGSLGYETRPRFSPGYGDLSLETQKIFFGFLKPEKIGLTLMDTLVMAPEKSVTAFIGWKKRKQKDE